MLSVDGTWNPFTEEAFKQICKTLGIAPERSMRTFRLIAGAAATPRTDAELDPAAREFRTDLKRQFDNARQVRAAAVVGGTPVPLLSPWPVRRARPVRERLDATVPLLTGLLREHTRPGPAHLVMDLAGVRFLASSVTRVLDLTGMLPLLDIHNTLDELLEHLDQD